MKLGLLFCGAAMAACTATPRPGALAVQPASTAPPLPLTEVNLRIAEVVTAAAADGRGGPLASLLTIGQSREGRPLQVLRLGADGDAADRRPALLIIAGIDPMHEVGVTVALGVARRLAAEHADLLGETTVYILPSLNPDAAEWLRAQPARRDHSRTLTFDDADRDGRTDEDGPADLDGDGFITMMRIADPRPGLGLEARYIIDPDNPRLLREPDRAKGERPAFALLVESLDADGDGLFAEDGPGGVDLDSNFPYRWPEFRNGAGRTPLSEPESLAVAQWILAPTGPRRDNILAVLVYAPGDNLLNTPPAGRMDDTNRVPLGIEEGDKEAYELIGAAFKDITGMTSAPNGESRWPGSLAGWAYGHVGVYAFTTPVWVRPDLVKKPEPAAPEDPPPAQPAENESPPADAATPAAPERASQPSPRGAAPPRPARGRPGRAGAPSGTAAGGAPAAGDTAEDAKWLAYFDARVEAGGEPGFIDWRPFDHPQLGPVEIGGFIPGAKLNPPPEEIDRLVDEQARFVADLLGRMPRLILEEPVTERLGDGLWRISVRIVNDGRLPTRSAIGVKTRRLPPIRLGLDLPAAAVVGGDRVQRTHAIPGDGGEFVASWIVAAREGTDVVVQLRSAELGDRDITARLQENGR